MKTTARLLLIPTALLSLHASAEEPEIDLLTGEGVSLGGVIFPHLHVIGVGGGTTADHHSQLAGGHHDPQDDITLQSLEPGLSLRAGDHLEGFATYSAFTDATGIFDGEWEEAFIKFKNIPGGLELRGGRFLNRFGYQNAVHNHGWSYVNNNLLNTRILQEGELITDGGEITWNVPTPFRSALSVSYGLTPPHGEHDHDHGHGDEHHEEPLFEGEGARFHDDFFTAAYHAQVPYNDFHQHSFNIGGAWGENEFGETTQIYGAGYEYLWRQNGYEPGGMQFRWRTEVAYRHFGASAVGVHHDEHGGEDHHDEHGEEDHHDEHGEEDHHDEHGEEDHHDEHGEEDHDEDEHHDEDEDGRRPGPRDLDEIGIYTSLMFAFNDHVETGVRFGYVGGIDDAGLDSRYRVSPNITFSLNKQRTLFARLQYDYDHSSDYGDSHSGWFQVGFNWGGPEVR